MMMALLVLKSRIKNFYETHYRPMRDVLKGCLIFALLLLITTQMNYLSYISHPLLLFCIAAAAAVTPDLISVLCVFVVLEIEICAMSPVLALSLVLVILIYYLLFGRLVNSQSILLMSVPVLAVFHLEYLVPLAAGLLVSPVMLPALVLSVLLRFVLFGIQEYALALSRMTGENTTVAALRYVLSYFEGNTLFYVMLAAFVLTFICVYLIRRAQMQYASQIAILVGAILNLAILLMSNIFLDLEIDHFGIVISNLISVVIAYILQFFHMTLDYKGTRKLQFEDDEYYYYVTAVPKFKVAVADKTLTRILPDDEEENQDLKTELEKELE